VVFGLLGLLIVLGSVGVLGDDVDWWLAVLGVVFICCAVTNSFADV
jgi:hypothetical protein